MKLCRRRSSGGILKTEHLRAYGPDDKIQIEKIAFDPDRDKKNSIHIPTCSNIISAGIELYFCYVNFFVGTHLSTKADITLMAKYTT